MPMVSCSDGHDEIHFEGHFSALCPLCAARAALAEAKFGEEQAYQIVQVQFEAAIAKIVHSEGAEREEAIRAAAKLVD